MKSFVAVLSFVVLAGCATAKFDNQQYSALTDIRFIAADKSQCDNIDTAKAAAIVLNQRITYVKMYTEFLPGEEQTVAMLNELDGQIASFAKNRAPGKVYCVEKLNNIEHGVVTMQKAIAKRER